MSDVVTNVRPLTIDDLFEEERDPSAGSIGGKTLIRRLLAEQQQLSAVEQFSRDQAEGQIPALAPHYVKLLPASPPGPGEQYAFEVNLDRCSGCKACVTACHSLNGLDDEETWRDVGLLIGGTESAPVLQHVTAACHHCLEPMCMSACPVNAYEKDPRTGIVKHLDDQCFGCQYCTLACPYNVPKYHRDKGIVRKCDMCSSRLERAEAPACVQACPHEAISIQVVSVRRVLEDLETNTFLPAAPEPQLTRPTTSYRTSRPFPRNMLPADYYSISPGHPHWPLILMLVLTQLSVGAFLAGCVLERLTDPALAVLFRPFHATTALVSGLTALLASTCHLGRPLYAFRGLLGLRHSWLSREILVFGLFAGLAVPYATACWATSVAVPFGTALAARLAPVLPLLGGLVAVTGIGGVFCSAMIYVFTKRELWSLERTLIRFALTASLLGIATTWVSLLMLEWFVDTDAASRMMAAVGRPLTESLLVVATIKLVFDALLLRSLADHRTTSLKRSALLVTGVLSRVALARFGLGLLGGIAMPVVVLNTLAALPGRDLTLTVGVLVMWCGCLAGEVLERYLFFAAASSPRMPGGIRP